LVTFPSRFQAALSLTSVVILHGSQKESSALAY